MGGETIVLHYNVSKVSFSSTEPMRTGGTILPCGVYSMGVMGVRGVMGKC